MLERKEEDKLHTNPASTDMDLLYSYKLQMKSTN